LRDTGSALKISNFESLFLAPLSRKKEFLRDLLKILICLSLKQIRV
jgi:hypothetical protein